jgi:hypothetical protein
MTVHLCFAALLKIELKVVICFGISSFLSTDFTKRIIIEQFLFYSSTVALFKANKNYSYLKIDHNEDYFCSPLGLPFFFSEFARLERSHRDEKSSVAIRFKWRNAACRDHPQVEVCQEVEQQQQQRQRQRQRQSSQ